MSCRISSKQGCPSRCARFSAAPVTKLSSPTTWWPRSSRRSQRWDPMNPAAPETTARTLLTADPPIDEAQPPHRVRVVDVAAVHHHRAPHRPLQPAQVELPELVPLGDDHH